VNAEEARRWPSRRRFTIGHELGHWVMHRRPGQQSLFCRPRRNRRGGPERLCGGSGLDGEGKRTSLPPALTMPADRIREHYERLKREDDCHALMCKLFSASGAAMGRRLHAVI